MKHYFILEDHKEQALALSKIIQSYKKDIEITVSFSIPEAINQLQHTIMMCFS